MSEPAIDIINFFIFIVPGAIAVWSFRYFNNSHKNGDFEYLTLSAFWGVVILAIQSEVAQADTLTKLLSNQYAATMTLSIIGFLGAFLIAWVKNFFKKPLKWVSDFLWKQYL